MDGWLQGQRGGDGFNGDYLVYDAQYVNNTRTEGDLIWYTSNGSEMARYRATSGSGKPVLYTLPEGAYLANKIEFTSDSRFMRHGIGFKVRLSPAEVWDAKAGRYRTGLLIHPARYGGTEGCIGLISENFIEILDFENRITTYLETNKSILLIVNYRRRP